MQVEFVSFHFMGTLSLHNQPNPNPPNPSLFISKVLLTALKKIPKRGGIAQLARAVALQAIGLGFKSPYLQEGMIFDIVRNK